MVEKEDQGSQQTEMAFAAPKKKTLNFQSHHRSPLFSSPFLSRCRRTLFPLRISPATD